MLLSEYEVRSTNIDDRCQVLFTEVQNRLLIVPDTNIYLVMDLSGKHFILPTVLALKQPLYLQFNKDAPVVIVVMPQNLRSNRLAEMGSGMYEVIEEWAEVAYVELLERIHLNGKLHPDDTQMLLSWSIFNAHKGYSEFIEKYTRSLLDHLSQDRLDSRGIRRAYKQYFGRSPQQLQTYARFNDSLYDYMKNGINPLWNYTDQAHWIRVCKKHTGMTPKRITSWHTLL